MNADTVELTDAEWVELRSLAAPFNGVPVWTLANERLSELSLVRSINKGWEATDEGRAAVAERFTSSS